MKKCTIKDCDKGHSARGLCHMHYQRFKRHGDPNFVNYDRVESGTWKGVDCLSPQCMRPATIHGLCSLHNSRDRRIRLKGIPKKCGEFYK